jgi:tripartite-type tricarboxylate transporter receptor subunit TctC
MIVPFPPAGSTDISARAVAGKLGERLGQPVVIENKPGAGGNIGTDVAAKAPPDGYTIVVGTVGTHAINAGLYSKMPYDNLRTLPPWSCCRPHPTCSSCRPPSRRGRCRT